MNWRAHNILHRQMLILLVGLVLGSITYAQEAESTARTAPAPRQAFFEDAPLAETGFAESHYNRKEQRLREHYLDVPVGELPEGREISEAAPMPPATRVLDPAAESTLSVAIQQNRALADSETNDGTSTVCEPSLAVRGQEILYTGNWFASFSRDGGATFDFRNPDTAFPVIPNRAFCCDQVAHYVPSHDLMVWFLQYVKDTSGNTVRLAVAHGDDIRNERWRIYDFTPQDVGQWTEEWFDYPDISYSNQFLFISTNGFSMANQFRRCVAIRIPLDELRDYAALNYRYFDRSDVGSLRLSAGAGDTMYLGCHENTGAIRVYAWPDANTSATSKTFNVQPWVRGGASAPGPDGRDWLGFVDGRITAGWTTGGQQGFAWTSAQTGAFTLPQVRVAIVNWNTGAVVSQPHIWSNNFAFAYPATCVNSSAHVGISLAYGGNQVHASSAVGLMNDDLTWTLVTTGVGTHGPDRNRWGDYLSMRTNGQNEERFVCTAFSLLAGPARQQIVPRVVQFDAVSQPETEISPIPAQPITATLDPISLAALEPELDEQETGYKFNPQQAANAPLATVVRMAHEMSLDTEEKAVITIPEQGNVNQEQMHRYEELSALQDIGEFFFEPPESVCTPDERTQILDTTAQPWSGNCQLVIKLPNGMEARGTGWFYGPRIIVTAGHCVHMGEGGEFFESIEVIPAMHGPARPFASQTVSSTQLRASENWKTSGAMADDYGAIILQQPFSNADNVSPTIYSVSVLDDMRLNGLGLVVSGYPADKPTGTQWMANGPIARMLPKRLLYMIDTYGGHSGSVVFAQIDGGPRAVGIHNYGGCPNKCTRITAEVKADLDAWAHESEQQ